MVITTQYNILDSEDSKKRRVCVCDGFPFLFFLQSVQHAFHVPFTLSLPFNTHKYGRNTSYRHPLSFLSSSTNGRIHFIAIGLDLGPPAISFLLSAFFPFIFSLFHHSVRSFFFRYSSYQRTKDHSVPFNAVARFFVLSSP